MAQFQPPPSLSLQGNLAENWRNWIQCFKLFCTASGITEKSKKVQYASFLHITGEEAIKVCNTFSFEKDERDKIDVLKRKFQEYCEPRKKLALHTTRFSLEPRSSQSLLVHMLQI